MNYINKKVVVRDYEDSDYNILLHLPLKQKDSIELYNMTSMSPIEYMEWHLENHSDKTKVIEYDRNIIGMIGIEEGTLWFTTIELSVPIKFSLVKEFNKVLNALILYEGVKSVIAYVDSTYIEAIRWIELGGFKKMQEVIINDSSFYIFKYTLKYT